MEEVMIMLRKATTNDKTQWVRLNREFMEFEITDNNLWNQIDKTKNLRRSSSRRLKIRSISLYS